MVVGYDNASQRFIVRNSWGALWGNKGYFTIPYAYFLNPNMADDLWTIRMVTPIPVVGGPDTVTASDLTATTTSGAPVVIAPKATCSNASAAIATYNVPALPANGTLTVSTTGAFIYTSTAGFTGTDSFTYTATDNLTPANTSNSAKVTVTVTPGAPPATGQVAYRLQSSSDKTTWNTLYSFGAV
jgi:hypothetical protein